MDFRRQATLDGISESGQALIQAARVLIVGAGGLGCPAAQYLAAAGVEHITLVDFDVVDATNLHRQVLYTAADVGQPKALVAADRLNELGIGIAIGRDETFQADMVDGHDVVLDCTDEPGTRALIHQACMDRGVPLVWAAVEGWNAQWAVVIPGAGPCLRCLWPAPGDAPSCADVGILGPIVGMAGTWQALAALRLVAGIPPEVGTLHLHELRSDNHETIRFDQRPDCPACAAAPK